MSSAASCPTMGATPHAKGVTFRVWAPNARAVAVVGAFNAWAGDCDPLAPEGDGLWAADVAAAALGDEYKFQLQTSDGDFLRIDPYAREVTSSVGNAIVHNPLFVWGDDNFQLAPRNELVIYELHVGTFGSATDDEATGAFAAAANRLGYLKTLGINAIQIMPVAEFAGDRSWGYNPAHSFSVELAYGGSVGLKRFVKCAHQHDIGVILDVVYNHLGPSDLDLWQFDGWSQNGLGGIYFYNDSRATTPWGDTRPDYGRSEVRQFICDNVRMWLGEYRIDGLRFDSTHLIRTVDGSADHSLPDGWSLLRRIQTEIAQQFPGRLTIAEDLQNEPALVGGIAEGGAGFDAQWDAGFVHPIRRAVIEASDRERSLGAIASAICPGGASGAFARVIYSESHDEVANGSERVPQEVNEAAPGGWNAQKRSTLAAAMVLTAPGVPMLFQGQEFMDQQGFADSVNLDWRQSDAFVGILRMYRDLIRLRRNLDGASRGLCGSFTHVHHQNEQSNILAFHRWDRGGALDDVVVVANFSADAQGDYTLGFPAAGAWQLRFNSDCQSYSADFEGYPSTATVAEVGDCDGMPCHAAVAIAPYSVLVFSQG